MKACKKETIGEIIVFTGELKVIDLKIISF